MEILGVGPMELILVLIIALMVFGPERLPEMGAKLGGMVRSMRHTTRQFSREIEQARQAIEEPVREVKQPLQEIKDSVGQIAPMADALAHPREAVQAAILKEFKEPGEALAPARVEAPPANEAPAAAPESAPAATAIEAAAANALRESAPPEPTSSDPGGASHAAYAPGPAVGKQEGAAIDAPASSSADVDNRIGIAAAGDAAAAPPPATELSDPMPDTPPAADLPADSRQAAEE